MWGMPWQGILPPLQWLRRGVGATLGSVSRRTLSIKAPFLRQVAVQPAPGGDRYPFNLALVQAGQTTIGLKKPVTIFVGENGSGKSSLLEGIAVLSGFNPVGGSADHRFGRATDGGLAPLLKLHWLPKIRRGFFFRAESFFEFGKFIDALEREMPGLLRHYGGRSLHAQSHGESFLALFEKRFEKYRDSLLIFDEPEAALSPRSQLAFLRILSELESANNQIILATHSPILMAYPGAQLFRLTEDGRVAETTLRETDHFLIFREFVKRPEDLASEFTRSQDDSADPQV